MNDKPAPLVSPWLTTEAAAAYADCHPQTLYAAAREYKRTKGRSGLRASQKAARGKWRFLPADLDTWLDGEPPKRRTPRAA